MQNSPKAHEWFFRKHIIAIIMWGLFAIIGLLLFSDLSKNPIAISEKIDPYVLSTKGNTLIIRNKLITVEENKRALIFAGDKIKTLDSTATIFWPDGSITRLGERSSIKIREIQAQTANESIRIDFSLEEGKSWSNVIKYMFGDSYFHERFNNDTALAAVRWTVFEVNLDHKYIRAVDHGISVQDTENNTGGLLLVTDGIIDTETRKALSQNIIDISWDKLNRDADIIYLNERMELLKKGILGYAGETNYMEAFLRKIGLSKTDSSLNALLSGNEIEWQRFEKEMKKWGNSGKLMDTYQQFYGLGNTGNLLDTKMKLRDLIIETAPENQKEGLLNDFARSTLYDSWSTTGIGTGSLERLQKKLEEYIKQGADRNIIDTLQNAARQGNIQRINKILDDMKQSIMKTLGEKNLMEEATEGVDIEDLKKINDTASSIRNSITDELQKLTQ